MSAVRSYTYGVWYRSALATIGLMAFHVSWRNNDFREVVSWLDTIIFGYFSLLALSIPSFLIGRFFLWIVNKSALACSEKFFTWCLLAMIAVFANPLTLYILLIDDNVLKEPLYFWEPYAGTLLVILYKYDHFISLTTNINQAKLK